MCIILNVYVNFHCAFSRIVQHHSTLYKYGATRVHKSITIYMLIMRYRESYGSQLYYYLSCVSQDVIDRVQSLIEEGRLSGVMDDRGKFIYITQDEYNAVAKFIRQRGRVSLRALAESSNQLIILNPNIQKTVHHELSESEVAS